MSKIVRGSTKSSTEKMVLLLNNELPTRIYFWNKEKQLLGKPLNLRLEVSFLLEEVSEFYRSETIEKQIDALCDTMVFAYGFMFKAGFNAEGNLYASSTIDEKHLIGLIYDIIDGEPLEETLGKLLMTCMSLMYSLGYDPSVALEEVVMHIESRVGSVDENGKWVKDKNVKVYEPNFKRALIEKE